MGKSSNSQSEKNISLNEIKEMVHSFCEKYFNKELEGYAVKLCNEVSRKRKINISHGQKEIWAASIIYVIARLNFLFDEENQQFITADTICNFFNTKKLTIGQKATQIEKICNLNIGAEGYCSEQITDSFSFYETPEGLVIPKSMIKRQEFIIEAADGEEAEEIEKFAETQKNIMEQEAKLKKERRAEINRKIGENRKRKKNGNQLSLFDDV